MWVATTANNYSHMDLSALTTAAEERLAQLEDKCAAARGEVESLRQRALAPGAQKRLSTAFALWLLCPFWPAYAFYLNRDLHCWLYTVTFGGFGLGWLVDGFCLPWYVADYNEPLGYLAREKRRRQSWTTARMLLAPFRLTLVYAIALGSGLLASSLLGSKRLEESLGERDALTARACVGLLGGAAGVCVASRCVASARARSRPLIVLGCGVLFSSLILGLGDVKAEEPGGIGPVLSFSSFGLLAGCSMGRTFDAARAPSRGAPSALLARLLLHGGGVVGLGGVAAAALFASGNHMEELPTMWTEVYNLITYRSMSQHWAEILEAMRDHGADAASLLGVERGATPAEVRQAHRKLARLHHPDKQQGASEEERAAAEELMRRLNAAKDVLLGEAHGDEGGAK